MEKNDGVQVVTVSGACCAPHMAKLDKQVDQALQDALGQLGIDTTVQKATLSGMLAGRDGLPPKLHALVLALFQKHNTRFTPAVFIDGELRFAGQPPTTEQLVIALRAAMPAAAPNKVS